MALISKYELHDQIGRGGFGMVYRATDTALDREVALKILKPELAGEPEFIERFQREARTMAKMQHENIVPIYDIGQANGRFFIAMRLMSGGSLAERLAGGPLVFEQAQAILRDVCAGLQEAHEQGLVHRDLKPANILFDGRGRAFVSDFGLARAAAISASANTSIGAVGTPFYRAPELWRGKPPASPATDVYSLGCILVEMLTGLTPYHGDTPDEVLARHLIDGPDFGPTWPPKYSPPEIAGLVEQALAKDPSARFQNAAEFARRLAGLPAAGLAAEPQPANPLPEMRPEPASIPNQVPAQPPVFEPVREDLRQADAPQKAEPVEPAAPPEPVHLVEPPVLPEEIQPEAVSVRIGNPPRARLGWSFWWKWVLVTTLPTGIIIFLRDYGLISPYYIDLWALIPFMLATVVIFFSLQWWLIRRFIAMPIRWIPLSIGGSISAVLFLLAFPTQFDSINSLGSNPIGFMLLILTIAGVILGTVQSLLLKRLFSNPIWWILANAASSGVITGLFAELIVRKPYFYYYYANLTDIFYLSYNFYIIAHISALFLYAGLTGLALLKMDRTI